MSNTITLHTLTTNIISRPTMPDLTLRQLAVLTTVYCAEQESGYGVKELSALLSLTKPAITRSLDRLTALSFVKRATSPADARCVVISRTMKGKAFLREIDRMKVAA